MELEMLLTLGGGLGLFIFGMKMLGEGLEKAAGDKLKRLLEILTENRFMGIIVGTIVTAIVQSSSATTVMLVGFVNAGLMTLSQTVGVIMGANIGTTITAQLIAFKLTKVAPIAVFVGVGFILFSKKRSLKKFGEILAGFGILFMGMEMMSTAMKPLRYNEAFQKLMVQFENPFFGVLAGFIVTALIQSSSASIGILQALAMQGLIGLDGAIYVLFGQNIGTCVTALLASIGTNINAKRASIIHLLFNVVGTLFFMALIEAGLPYIDWVTKLSPNDTVRQIANAHTGFNVLNTVLMFPLGGYLVYLAEKLVPGKTISYEEKRLMYLDKRILETPPIAVAQIMKEVGRMANLSRDNVRMAMEAFYNKDESLIQEVLRREEIINFLNREITHYLVMANGLDLRGQDLQLVGGLFHVVNDIERVGDHAENLVEYAEYSIENNLTFSDMAIQELKEMTDKVLKMLDDSIEALKTRNKDLAQGIEAQEEYIDELMDTLRNSHISRLNNQTCNPGSGVIFLDIVTNLERVADHATNIAYSVMD